jgi:16S rRNA (adenine1518-N6/adenine1519-N6)-dimethyltransferase
MGSFYRVPASGAGSVGLGVMADALLGPAEIRELAARLGIAPTKKLGQNFVHDPNTVRRIVAAAGLRPDDVVLEVGPGLGSLTLGLVGAVAHVHTVEIDPALAAALPATVRAPNLTVHPADALKVTAADFTPAPTLLVANLPYNVAVPVVLHLLAELPTLRGGLVMVQKEVADRLVAGPGSKVYGVPSVKLAWYATARAAGRVPPAVFWPVPNVDSGLVAFTRRDPVAAVDRRAVFTVVDAAFAQRRKTLRAALAGWAGGADRAEQLLVAAGVSPQARGESLTVEQFAAIAATAGARGYGGKLSPSGRRHEEGGLMTAEPTAPAVWSPDPTRQRAKGYTLEDVFKLPDDAPRVELLDGVLSVVPSPSGGHQKLSVLLASWFMRHAPEEFETLVAVGVVTGVRNTLEPDLVLLHRPVDLDHHFFDPAQVALAIEIVSPSTRRRDRLEKPSEYAAAGVPHFWRIERHPTHVFAYDLVDGRYELAAESTDELRLSAPFGIRLPIPDITP